MDDARAYRTPHICCVLLPADLFTQRLVHMCIQEEENGQAHCLCKGLASVWPGVSVRAWCQCKGLASV